MSEFILGDCIEGMKRFPDKYFDLAIVDPPYGGGAKEPDANGIGGVEQTLNSAEEADSEGGLRTTISATRTGKWSRKYQTNGGIFSKDIRHWDIAPPPEYFKELARVSKNQIIWGGNYFDLPPTRCFIVWYKQLGENFSMAMCEYAWTSFNDNAKLFECAPQGTAKEKRFHPTQKPIALYTWLLNRYAKEGYRILDTHVGSASSLIACHRAGLEYVGFEIDPTYYKMASERLEQEKAQISFFDK